MWKYTVINKDGEVFTDIYQSDMDYKASEICKILESSDFEVLELKKVEPVSLAALFIKTMKDKKLQVAGCY